MAVFVSLPHSHSLTLTPSLSLPHLHFVAKGDANIDIASKAIVGSDKSRRS